MGETRPFKFRPSLWYNMLRLLASKLLGKEGERGMRKFRCLECKHEFETEAEESLRCPKCLSHYLLLLEGKPLKGKRWGSKSYSIGGSKK